MGWRVVWGGDWDAVGYELGRLGMVVGGAGRVGMEVGGVKRGTGRTDATGFQLVYQNGCQITSNKI